MWAIQLRKRGNTSRGDRWYVGAYAVEACGLSSDSLIMWSKGGPHVKIRRGKHRSIELKNDAHFTRRHHNRRSWQLSLLLSCDDRGSLLNQLGTQASVNRRLVSTVGNTTSHRHLGGAHYCHERDRVHPYARINLYRMGVVCYRHFSTERTTTTHSSSSTEQ